MYTYGHFMLMYGRGHHNIVIILQLKIVYLYEQTFRTIFWEVRMLLDYGSQLQLMFSNSSGHCD